MDSKISIFTVLGELHEQNFKKILNSRGEKDANFFIGTVLTNLTQTLSCKQGNCLVSLTLFPPRLKFDVEGLIQAALQVTYVALFHGLLLVIHDCIWVPPS